MSKDAWRHLIRDFTQMLGVPEPFAPIEASCSLMLDGVSTTLVFNPLAGELVQIFIDFGEVPQGNALEVFRRLLEINLLLETQGSPRLALDPASARVIFSYVRPLSDLTPDSLLAGLRTAVGQAHAWRETFFLDDESDRLMSPSPSPLDLRHALHV